MNAELISVGTEILLGQIVNTNAAWLAQRLAELGVNVYRQETIGDNLERLSMAIRESLDRADILILTGGLGPTDDDLTREGVAMAMSLSLEEDGAQRQWLEERLGQRMTENNLKQALKPAGAIILPNPGGTACGYAVPADGRWVFMLPGPPWEMEAMYRDHVRPFLQRTYALNTHLYSRILHFIGIGESALETELLDLMRRQKDPSMALYAKTGEIELRLTTRAETEELAMAQITPLEEQIRNRVGQHLYGYDDDTLFTVTAKMLLERGLTLSVAESCTGGLLGNLYTDIPGSSGFFCGGWIAYSNEMKMQHLGVPAEILERYGAVSARTVAAMSQGARSASGSDLAISISGVAGPGGGSESKPVGLIYQALASQEGTLLFRNTYSQDRLRNKFRAAKQSAYLLWLYLQGLPVPAANQATLEN
ncbi:MAG: competence/damage-inducible protein A [Symbiobacteriaceae bacterium]|nr:competence/damage-inducible protein A [Symbiobacteriaceae bacterium]